MRLTGETDETLRQMFPSPCGEEVMKSSRTCTEKLDGAIRFPSPCGEEVMKFRLL